jgi:tetratricopeptide (TPR) repeat protein
MLRRLTKLLIISLATASFLNVASAVAQSRYIRKAPLNSRVIVFVHGVLGDSRSTWTNGTFYWPEMISKDKDFADTDIFVYEYPSRFLGNDFSIDEVSENLRLQLDVQGVTAHEKVAFVAHSMGGLVVRAYLLKYREAAAKTVFLSMFSTPTTGSDVAALASIISTNLQIARMTPMRSDSYLADQQRQWLAAGFDFPTCCAYETKKTFGLLVVSQASASNLCSKRLDPIDADHISIVKPSSVDDASYQVLKSAFMDATSGNRKNGEAINPRQQLSCQGNFAEECTIRFRRDALTAFEACQRYSFCDPHNSIAQSLFGQISHTLGHYAEAKTAFERELREGQIQNDKGVISHAYQNLASVSLERGLLDQAEFYAKSSLDAAPNKTSQGIAYRWLGDIAFKRGNIADAASEFEASIKLLRTSTDRLALASAYVGLGMSAVKAGVPIANSI